MNSKMVIWSTYWAFCYINTNIIPNLCLIPFDEITALVNIKEKQKKMLNVYSFYGKEVRHKCNRIKNL